jgi:hypothetical protein
MIRLHKGDYSTRKSWKMIAVGLLIMLAMSMITTNVMASGATNSSSLKKMAVTQALTFNDVHNGYWAYRDIRDLVNKGVISGYSKGIFGPEARVTRAEFAKMIYLAKSIKTIGDSTSFLDLSDTHWAFNYVEGAVKEGYINGYENYTFRPDAEITRAEIVKILIKAEKFKIRRTGTAPVDVNDSHWASDYIMTAKAIGLMGGYSNGWFYPDKGATRAEACRLINKAVYQIDDYRIGDVERPNIEITSPTSNSSYETNTTSISISGTASDTGTVAKVDWANSRGGSGLASGTTSWSISNIQLQKGTNRITVTAEDKEGNDASDTITITCNADPATKGTLSGTVTDTSTANAISGALVSVYNNGSLITSGSTNSSGSYSLSLDPGTNYSIQYSKTGYGTYTQNSVTVTINAVSTVNAKLTPIKYGTFTGTIEETGTVMGLSGVKIKVNLNGVLQQETMSTSSGTFTIALPANSGYSAIFEKAGYKTYTIGSFDINEGTNTYSDVRMEPEAL